MDPDHDDRAVTEALAGAPTEKMPEAVLAGLLQVLDEEVRRRDAGEAAAERAATIAASLQRTSCGSFGPNLPRRPTLPRVTPARPEPGAGHASAPAVRDLSEPPPTLPS